LVLLRVKERIKMYHIELTKRIPPSTVIVEIISIDSPDEFEEKILNIREKYGDLEISYQELVDIIFNREKVAFEVGLYSLIGNRTYEMLEHYSFHGDDGIVELLQES
jgi:hypothetical protein